MAIFSVFRVLRPEQMTVAMQREFPDDHMRVHDDEWIVSASGTAKDVADKLGISDGDTGPAIVFRMANYFGRASTEIWDWIKAKAEADG